MDGLLRGLGAEDRERLLASMRRRRFGSGERLMRQGEAGDTFHRIESGHVAVQVTTIEGIVATLNILGPGDVVGELSLVESEGVRSASIVAMDQVETLSLGRDTFDQLRADRPEMDRFLVTLLADHVRRLSAQLRDSYVADAETRVFRRLLALALSYQDGSAVVVVPVDQGTLAALAGSSRQTANRALRAAQDAGWLRLRRKRIEVTDLAELTARAD